MCNKPESAPSPSTLSGKLVFFFYSKRSAIYDFDENIGSMYSKHS